MKSCAYRNLKFVLFVSLIFSVSFSLQAAPGTWNGNVDSDWSNALNWSGALPSTGTADIATFNNATNTNVTIDASRAVYQVVFDTGAGAFRFSGGPLVLAGNTLTINAGVTKSQTFLSDVTASGVGPTFNNASTTAGVIYNLKGNIYVRPASNGSIGFGGLGAGHVVWGNISNNGASVANFSKDFNASNLILRGSNSYTGLTTLTRGAVFFDSIAAVGGGNSSFGAPTTVPNGTLNVASSTGTYELSMVYTGSGHTTDRAVNIASGGTMGLNFTAYGSGALQWDGNIGSTHTNAATTHSFTLAGGSTAENRVGGVISNSTAGGLTLLNKAGQSTWNLTGTNTYTGNTSVSEGLLRLDFSNAAAPSTNIISSSSALVMEGGTLALRGKTSGTSSQTVNNFTLNSGHSKILADGNGGTSTTLNLGTITRYLAGVGATLDVTLASTGAVTTSTSTMTNSVISSNGVAFATANGSDWATYNAGNIEALGTYETSNDQANWAAAENISLSANPLANVTTGSVNTLRITNGSTVTITSANTLTLDAGGLLLTGTGNALITGGTLRGSGGTTKELVVFQNKTSGTAEIASVISNNGTATAFTKAGDGTLTLSGTNNYSGATAISGGVLKVAGTSNYGTGGVVLNGGVLGLSGGDLLNIVIGTGASGRLAWTNSGGFAAYGADRTVTFSTNPSWGATANFLGVQDALILGANDADAKIIWATSMSIQGGSATISPREIRVMNGAAAVDAEISGVLSTTAHGGIVKTGAGTLLLSNTNTYDGPTMVMSGTLIVNGSIGNSMLTSISSGAKLAGTGTTAQIELMAGGAIAPGNSIGTLSTSQNGNSDLVWNGETSGSFGQMQFELDSGSISADLLDLGAGMLDKGTGSAFVFDFLGTGGAGYTYTLINFGLTDFSVGDFSYSNLASGLTGSFSLNSTNLQFTTSAIPEPSVYAMLVGGLGLLAFLRRRKQS